ncbi:hypothetical protein JCM17380_44440 [Desulfosporosinus burensis]
MKRKAKQKLLNSCLAAAVALSATLTPVVANAAPTAAPSAVTRIGGYDQYATAALMAQKGWTGTCDSVVLSAGMTYSLVDALAAGPLAAKLNAPILLTDNGQTLNSSAKAELLRLKPKKVYITSGTAVIKQSVLNEISAMGIAPVQLGGYDQYETSVNIAKEMAKQGVDITRVMLAAGWLSPADALSIAPIAAAKGIPILTTTQAQLPASVKTYLDSIKAKVTDSYVVGGTAVVSDTVKAQLTGNVKRYSGLTKYDTNIQILKGFAKEYRNDKVYVANGETLVDALAGVPLAAANRSPVVLVNQQLDNSTKEFVKLNMSIDDMVALGGEVVVPTAGLDALTSAVSYATDSATLGSTDVTKPLELTNNVKITGNDVTLENAVVNYSVYVKGNNVTLSNLTVKGTVFVDPGNTGSATIDGVTAANIVILSGAPHSVIVTRSTVTGEMTISSDGNTNIVLSSVTTNGVTVQTHEIYETDELGNQVKVGTISITSDSENNLGAMTITSQSGETAVVNLSGEFNEPITVQGQGGISINTTAGTVISSITSNTSNLTLSGAGTYTAVVAQSGTLTAATGTVLPSVTVATTAPGQVVTLAGTITNVTQTQGNVTLAAGTKVENLTTTSDAVVVVPPGSSITNLVSTGPTTPTVYGGGVVNGETTPTTGTGGTGGTGGSGGSTTSTATILSIKSATTGNDIASISGTQITITPSAAAFKQPNIKVDQNATMNLKVNRLGTIYDLGSWNLTNSASGNDIFSASNAVNLNVLNTLNVLKATGVQSSSIFSAIDFHAVLTAAQGMTSANKTKVYDSIADIFSAAKNTDSANAFYEALNLPGVYAAADVPTQTTICNIISNALPDSPDKDGIIHDLLMEDSATSAAAVATLTDSGQMDEFFRDINFQALFDALANSSNKEDIFTAINFTALYNAIETLDSKLTVYIALANIYQAALTVDTGNAIDYGALLQLIITIDNTVNLSLTNGNGTKTYTVVKGS